MDQPKVLITDKADQIIEQMLKSINEDFASGRVRKTQLLSWIVAHFHENLFTKQIYQIRADHFDQVAHLRGVIKQMAQAKKTNSKIELDKLLLPLKSGKKTKKPKLASEEKPKQQRMRDE